jgi:hypothetical protein
MWNKDMEQFVGMKDHSFCGHLWQKHKTIELEQASFVSMNEELEQASFVSLYE